MIALKRRVILPKPLAHQKDILLDGHRFKIACCGRRFGKTLFGLIAVLVGHGPWDHVKGCPKFRGALHGATIWWVAPTYDISKKIWRDLKRALNKWGGTLEKDEQGKRIEFPGGGSITIKSAHEPDSLRGEGIHGLVIDEAATCKEDAWTLALAPTLIDFRGWCIMIGTPKGKNWFYNEWLTGSEQRDPDYASWRRPSSDNPTLPAGELERMRRKIGEYGFAQECLAEFELRAGGMFKRDWFQFYAEQGDEYIPESGAPVNGGLLHVFASADLAFSTKTWSDFTVVMVWGRAPDRRLFLLDLVRGKFEAPTIVPTLKRIIDEWGCRSLWLEASGPLVRLNAEAREAMPGKVHEVPIHAHVEGRKLDKVGRAQPAAAAVEGGRVLLRRGAPWVTDLISECCAFPDKSEPHDDQVDALALGVHAAPPAPPASPGVFRVPPQPPPPENPGWLIGR